MSASDKLSATIEFIKDKAVVLCKGCWTVDHVSRLQSQVESLTQALPEVLDIDGREMQKVDSAGALLLQELMSTLTRQGKKIRRTAVSVECSAMLSIVRNQRENIQQKIKPKRIPNFLYSVGEQAVDKLDQGLKFIAFIGLFTESVAHQLRHFRHPPWKSVFVTIDEAGSKALPIVALLTFLVGVVISFQVSMKLQTYGANIFVVDLSGFVILREMAPLITAVIAAGRTSTAFTAQIGTMKVNEEIDALKTMGVSPFERLVNPKVIGLIIALPLLTVWADVFGMLGAMMMASLKLNISATVFLNRFQQVIQLSQLMVGLVKVPIFALVISLVGCFQGFQVEHSADDVGRKTTKSAVQTIFLIIIVDALFSVFFSIRGI